MVLQCKKDLVKILTVIYMKLELAIHVAQCTGMHVVSDLLGWHLRKAATNKANVRMVVVSIFSLSSIACAEVYIAH
jgi:hypothetical protein